MGFLQKNLDIFEQMLVFDTVRGKDSTGVMSIKNDGSVDVVKHAEQPYFMLKTSQWAHLRTESGRVGRIIAGHNRAATRGNVTNENAHPFYEDNIVLMHNGTLEYGWEKLTEAKVEVDSHAICHALANGTPQEVIPTIKGAFALLWFDLETERFYAVRNKERPLCLITTAEHYYLASESWMATIPLMRNQIKVEDNILIEPGDLFSWDIRGNMKMEAVKLHEDNGVMSQRYQDWLRGQGWEDDLGESIPGKTTQVSYLPGAQPKAETKDCSPSSTSGTCALTTTTKSASELKKSDSTADSLSSLERQQAPLKIEMEELPKGKEVMVKIWDIKMLPNGAIKWTGKLHEPGVELLDAQGFLPRGILGNEWPAWMEHPIVAKVGWITKTVCGPTVYVRDCERIEQKMVHNGKLIPQKLWYHAHNNCTCRDCGQKVEDWEANWTSVKLKGIFGSTKNGCPLNTVEVVCPDCIMRSLDGSYYEQYTQAYYQKRLAVVQSRKGQPATSRSPVAVQDREPERGEPVGKNGSTIAVPGPATLQ